ncbi:hypothetical protein [Sinanaerobacter chloroacetimidivorans]|uniref:Uncharacterized protein n=1 Tax=Sinanaerobacter chloroacetimidivorans TaxID=2818044 RepID=A0A8J8B3S0_9FIRM|nr:hypothetical protein [Sinanaerobacter chloroacetimidivorans]MBR0598600.1 hypothetical protein [Sinanaerobacter chloroacetimidivorans]
MIPIDPKTCKNFIDEISIYESDVEKLVTYFIVRYLDKGLEFHNIVLRSKILFEISLDNIKELYLRLEAVPEKIRTTARNDLNFILFVRNRQMICDKQIKDLLINPEYKLCIEDILFHLEYTVKLIEGGKPFLGQPNNKKISSSQLEHLQESFDVVVEYIIKNSLPFSYKTPLKSKFQNICDQFFLLTSYLKSFRDLLEEHSYRSYIPYLLDDYWILNRNPEYWAKMEKYRDLNDIYQEEIDKTLDEEVDLMQNVGALKIHGDNEVVRIDFAKASEFAVAMQIHQNYKKLIDIYGDPDTEFTYRDRNYSVNDLLCLIKAVYAYITEQNEDKRNIKSAFLCLMGRKALLRAIGLDNAKEGNLLDLLSYDLNNDVNKHYLVHDKVLLKSDNLFFILPSRINEIAIERMLDKILTNQVAVNFKRENKSEQKGFVFEDNLENFFKSMGLKFGRVPQNKNRGVPEIDGMFVFDNYVFIYEAKASILPNSAIDTYNFLKDTLLKAREQIDCRMFLILENPDAKAYIEQKSGIDIENLNLAPFILLNHRKFSGYKELKSSFSDFYFPVVCFDDLKTILAQRIVPVWNYNKDKDMYARSVNPLNTGEELWNFMLNQFENLETMEEPIVHLNDLGVGYQIVRPTIIDDTTPTKFQRKTPGG